MLVAFPMESNTGTPLTTQLEIAFSLKLAVDFLSLEGFGVYGLLLSTYNLSLSKNSVMYRCLIPSMESFQKSSIVTTYLGY